MKKKQELEDDEHEHELEIIKAVAQAWHGHSSSSRSPRSTNEFDARRLNFKSKPTRFKLEAMNESSSSSAKNWDFGQSLWDSYEIVAVSKRLEEGLVLDPQFTTLEDTIRMNKRRKESKNSLRNLFKQMSSKRFKEAHVPHEEEEEEEGTQF